MALTNCFISGLEVVGHLMIELTEKDLAESEWVIKNGITHYRAKLVISVRLNDDAGHLVYRVLHDGKEIGRTNVLLDD